MVRVDAVVVSYNSRDTLRGCVEPLAGMPGVAVKVVDNASPDDGLATIADLPVEVIRSGRNGGFAFGCNLGAAAGSAPYVLLLNPDARLDREALDALVAVLDREPGVALAGPRQVDDDGGLVLSQRTFPRLRTAFAKAFFVHRVLPRAGWTDDLVYDRAAYESPGSPDWISGACMLIRRSALESVGGLDEGFFLYCEETDLCRRLRQAGHDIRFEPRATVRHTGGASVPRAQLLWIHARSRLRYGRKHRRPLAARIEALAILLEAATHALVNLYRPPVARGHVRAMRALLQAGAGERS
jgi:N-acetylglucosaminyl-diphospho-decaprenol L-rhamnosyltransferase